MGRTLADVINSLPLERQQKIHQRTQSLIKEIQMTDDRWDLVENLSRKLIEMYDAAEDYSEDQLYNGMQEASEAGVTDIARDVLEGTVAMVIDELLTTDTGLSILYRINAHRENNNTNKVTDTNQVKFSVSPDTITVISKNFTEPQPGDYKGIPLAHIPYAGSCSYERAMAIGKAILKFALENPPEQ